MDNRHVSRNERNLRMSSILGAITAEGVPFMEFMAAAMVKYEISERKFKEYLKVWKIQKRVEIFTSPEGIGMIKRL